MSRLKTVDEKICKKNKKEKKSKEKILLYFKQNWILYLMLLPVVVYFAIFSYVPMYGILLAFKDYRIKAGIIGSPWVGFKHFERFFSSYYFRIVIGNTLKLNIYSLLVGFPLPIIFALLLNYLKYTKLKKVVQMISYAPYFISTVVICNLIATLFDFDMGIFNTIRNLLGYESLQVLALPSWFDDIYVWSGVWQGMGWSAIIYVSALSGVDPQLHEAAIIDGATKVQRIWHVDLPSIRPTIIMLLILAIGGIMGGGFEKAYLLQNDLNLSASETIATYVYKQGMVRSDYSFSTAIGLFNTLINLALLLGANKIADKLSGESLF